MLAAQVSISAVPLTGVSASSGWPITLAPLPGDGAVVAFTGAAGGVHLTRVDAAGARTGVDLVIPGASGHGLAVTPTGVAVLVRRQPGGSLTDELWLVEVDGAGATRFQVKIIGGNDSAVQGTDHLSAYFTLQRRWPDNIAHQGDSLRHFASNGASLSGGWGWGCSHSLDLRLARNSAGLGPVCLSDCYPLKAIMFNHNGATLFPEPSGNCSGGSAARLGGVVAVPGGFWVNWTSPEGRSSADVGLVHVSNSGTVGAVRWLTSNGLEEYSPHLAAFGGAMLAGWEDGSALRLVRLDSAGALVGAPEAIGASIGHYDDFATFPSGDVGWAYSTGAELKVVRVRRCP